MSLVRGSGCVTAAKNIRKELKENFPCVKFSVRVERFSGGESINIYWVDGPTVEQVRKVSRKYQHGYFDAMTDTYVESSNTFDFGSSKYVFEHRSYSDQAVEHVINKLAGRWGRENIPTPEEYNKGLACGKPAGSQES